jgi:protoporphyrin/coproporphyrin ferrochelatase
MSKACLLVGHGTVDTLSDLPAFLKNIRRGHDPSPELVAEVTHRYAAIGEGGSPLNRICLELATKVEAQLGIPTRFAARLWKPTVSDMLESLIASGAQEIALVPLAQFSSYVYAEHAAQALKGIEACRVEGGKPAPGVTLHAAPNWGHEAALTHIFAQEVKKQARGAHVIFTAHSLPMAIVAAGDPYDKEVAKSAELVAAAAGLGSWEMCFQSQGMSKGPGGRPVEWLGPDLRKTLECVKERGVSEVLLAPIGFLADHVEILYDLDIEAQGWAKELGITVRRTESLNVAPEFVDLIASLAKKALL